METLRALFVAPDPQAQFRKCNALMRTNMRKLDREMAAFKAAETKTKNLILAADKRGQRNPAQRKQAERDVRSFARELVRQRKAADRLATSKAQLGSVQLQVNEAFALRKIEGSIRASVGVMKDVNALVRLPELAGTMRDLSMELMKAGIIEEMVGETLPDADLLEEDEAEADSEVDKVLGEILKDRMANTGPLPSVPLPQQPVAAPAKPQQQQQQQQEEEEDEDDTEAMMDQMRNRLEALRS